MYVPEFLCGVAFTILIELAIVIVAAFRKEKK